jgi:hypothetical protein
VYITKTWSERIARSVKFLLHRCKLPKTTATDSALEAANRLIQALQNPAPGDPFSEDPNDSGAAIKTLANIFKHKVEENVLSPRVPIPQVTTVPSPRVMQKVVQKPVPSLRVTNVQNTQASIDTAPLPATMLETPREKRACLREKSSVQVREITAAIDYVREKHRH